MILSNDRKINTNRIHDYENFMHLRQHDRGTKISSVTLKRVITVEECGQVCVKSIFQLILGHPMKKSQFGAKNVIQVFKNVQCHPKFVTITMYTIKYLIIGKNAFFPVCKCNFLLLFFIGTCHVCEIL